MRRERKNAGTNALIVAFGKKKNAEGDEPPPESSDDIGLDADEEEAITMALGTSDPERIKAFKAAVQLCMQAEEQGDY